MVNPQYCIVVSLAAFFSLPAQTPQELDSKADSLYYHQSYYYTDAEYEAEIAIRQQVLEEYADTTSTQFKEALAKKYASEASYLIHNMHYDDAIGLSKKALQVYDDSGMKNQLFKAMVKKKAYYAHHAIGDKATTAQLIRESLSLFKDTLGQLHHFVSDVEFDFGRYIVGPSGDYDMVIDQYKKAIDISVAALGENNRQAAIQEHNLALAYGFLGYYQEELRSYLRVIKHWEALTEDPDKSYLAIAYGSLATWYGEHGDSETALFYLNKRLALIKEHRTNVDQWFNETYLGRTQNSAWLQLASFNLHKGDTTKAIDYLNKVKDYFDTYDFDDPKNNPHNLPYSKQWAKNAWLIPARFEAELNEKNSPKKAIRLYEKLIALRKQNDYSGTSLDIIRPLHRLYIHDDNYLKAENILTLGLKESKKKSKTFDIVHYHAALGNLKYLQQDSEQMRKQYVNAFSRILKNKELGIDLSTINYEDCKPLGDMNILDATLLAGDNFYGLYQELNREEDLKIAHNLNFLAADMFSENFSQMVYNDQNYGKATMLYDQLLNTTLTLNKKEEYKTVLTKLEEVGSQLSWKKFMHSQISKHLDVPDSILETESNLRSEIHFYKKQLVTTKDIAPEKEQLWKEKIDKAEKELVELQQWFFENYPSYANQSQRSFDLENLQKQLKRRQQVIKYVFGTEDLFALVLTKQEVHLLKIGNIETISGIFRDFIESLTDISSKDYINLGRKAYDILLPEEILGDAKLKELIFVMDDILHYLPMEALLNSEEEFLIQNYRVSYASSLLLFNEQLEAKTNRKSRMGIFAPSYKTKNQSNKKRDDRSALKGAGQEAKAIANLFNAPSFIGEKANKEFFIKSAGNFGVLHLAMHSTVNNIAPEFSNLNFSNTSEDNKLFVSELYNIPLSANLVVLSACNTGSGELKKGEGILNVSRAFTYAGVPSTVASLWSVPDKETSEVMIAFYEFLKQGLPKNEALARAKTDFLKNTTDSNVKHPYFWAGFTLNGNVSPIEIQTQPSLYQYALIAALILLILFLFRKHLVKLLE